MTQLESAVSTAWTLLVVLVAAVGVFIGCSVAIALMWSNRHDPAYIAGGLAYFGACTLVAVTFFVGSRRRGGTRERALRTAALGVVFLHVLLSPYGLLILSFV